MVKLVLKVLQAVISLVVASILFGVLISLPFQLAWNLTMPHIFHLPEINLVQAFFLLIMVVVMSPAIKSSVVSSQKGE